VHELNFGPLFLDHVRMTGRLNFGKQNFKRLLVSKQLELWSKLVGIRLNSVSVLFSRILPHFQNIASDRFGRF